MSRDKEEEGGALHLELGNPIISGELPAGMEGTPALADAILKAVMESKQGPQVSVTACTAALGVLIAKSSPDTDTLNNLFSYAVQLLQQNCEANYLAEHPDAVPASKLN